MQATTDFFANDTAGSCYQGRGAVCWLLLRGSGVHGFQRERTAHKSNACEQGGKHHQDEDENRLRVGEEDLRLLFPHGKHLEPVGHAEQGHAPRRKQGE